MQKFFYEKKYTIMSCIGLFIYVCFLMLIGVSLVSYNTTDPSFLYVTTHSTGCINKAGTIGAHIAAMLFYVFGGASFLLCIPLLFVLFFWIFNGSLRLEWDRLVASFATVFIGALFLATYQIDFWQSPFPGGKIGKIGAEWLLLYGDEIGRLLFLYCAIAASMIILLRWSFMPLMHYIVIALNYSWLFLNYIGSFIIQTTKQLFSFFISLYRGYAFEQTGLLYPEENAPQDNTPFTFISSQQDDSEFNIADNMDILSEQSLENIQTVRDEKSASSDQTPRSIERDTLSEKPDNQYVLPPHTIFKIKAHDIHDATMQESLQERAQILEDKLKRFGVNGSVVAIKRGPVVTLFEYQPEIDTKLSKIIALEDDLAMALQAMSIRIIAPIPGRSVVGFEVSNTHRQDVLFKDVISHPAYTQFSGSLPLILGKDTIGDAVVVDLARMPHLLIAGSTGTGKSVCLNALLTSLLCSRDPDSLKLILIDPKRLEFAAFTDIAHLLFPIVTSPHQAAPALRWVVQEMEDRYEKMAQVGARNINDYNNAIAKAMADKSQNNNVDNYNELKLLPFIVVVIDELADLMITAGRDIEDLITRITQMARAAGIHMIVATQRPSVDVITGLIKANFPSRISFKVASRIDSRTILDATGADRLLGRGDMLFIDAASSQLKRVHGAYVSDEEIEKVTQHIHAQRKVEYLNITLNANESSQILPADDLLYKDIRLFLEEADEISISLLQQKFRIGYNRSARIIDMLESQGLIMPQDGSKRRKVIR